MTLALDGDVTTFIGLNESGKTTILEAIFCFSYGAEDLDAINPNLASLRNPEQWIPISKRANFNDNIEIKATVELDDQDVEHFKRTMKSSHDIRVDSVPTELTIAEVYSFENSRYTTTRRTWSGITLTGSSGRQRTSRRFKSGTPEWKACVAELKLMLPRIYYFPNFLFELPDRFELSNDDSAEDEVRDRNYFYRSTFEQVLEDLGYNATIQTHIVDRLGSTSRADRTSLSAVLLDMSRTITTTIFEGWNRIFGRAPTAQEVELAADSDDDSPAFLELKIKGPTATTTSANGASVSVGSSCSCS